MYNSASSFSVVNEDESTLSDSYAMRILAQGSIAVKARLGSPSGALSFTAYSTSVDRRRNLHNSRMIMLAMRYASPAKI